MKVKWLVQERFRGFFRCHFTIQSCIHFVSGGGESCHQFFALHVSQPLAGALKGRLQSRSRQVIQFLNHCQRSKARFVERTYLMGHFDRSLENEMGLLSPAETSKSNTISDKRIS